MKISEKPKADETVLLERGINQFEVAKGDRQYVQLFDTDGNSVFYGIVSVVRVEVLGRKEAPKR